MLQHPKGIKLPALHQGSVIRRPDLPPRSTGHTTETPTGTGPAVARQLLTPYHNLVDPIERKIYNLVSWDRAALSLRGSSFTGGWETNHAGVRNIQWSIVGYAADMPNLPPAALKWLAEEFLAPMLEINKIPNSWSKSYGPDDGIVLASIHSPIRMGGQEWYNFSGVTYHQTIPGQDHWDMGKIDWRNLTRLIKADQYNEQESTRPVTYPGENSVISFGDQGPEVRRLEQLLVDYFPTLVPEKMRPDAKFGKLTRRAVRAVQRELGVTPDGYWGPHSVQAFKRWRRELGEAVANGVKPDPEKDKVALILRRQDNVTDRLVEDISSLEVKFMSLYKLLGNKDHPATKGLLEMIQELKQEIERLDKMNNNLRRELKKE